MLYYYILGRLGTLNAKRFKLAENEYYSNPRNQRRHETNPRAPERTKVRRETKFIILTRYAKLASNECRLEWR